MKAILVLLIGFASCCLCAGGGDHRASKELIDNAKTMQFLADEKPVDRGAFYTKERFTLACVPPTENDNKANLAIYNGRGATKESTPRCSSANLSSICTFSKDKNMLSFVVHKTSSIINFTCQYVENPEHLPVKPAEVNVYFEKGGSIEVYNDQNERIQGPIDYIPISNETAYRFKCPMSGSEENTKVKWYRNGHEIASGPFYEINEINGTNVNLTFKTKTAKSLDASKYGGWYRCERWDKDEKTLLVLSFIKINSNAYVAPAQKSYNKMETESVSMACDVEGEPVPQVTWVRINADKERQSLDAEKDPRITFGSYKGVQNASITIEKLASADYGEYICVATSGSSTAEAVLLLRVRSKLAALWPFLGIVAEVIILVAIIFIYEKRRSKKEQDETEEANDQKKSLTASNNESKDIRQRKA